MAQVVSNKRSPIETGLTGLAGAFSGKVAGEEKNIDRALMERDQTRQENQLNETTRNNTIMQEMAARQLEVMQEQNRLSRDQEDRLTRYREGQENVRQTRGIDASASEQRTGIEASLIEQANALQQSDIENRRNTGAQIFSAKTSAAARRYSADRSKEASAYSSDQSRAASEYSSDQSRAARDFSTEMTRRTAADRQQSLDLERLSDTETQLNLSRQVLDSYTQETPWARLNEETKQSAARDLAKQRIGQKSWDGTGDVTPATEPEKMQAQTTAYLELSSQESREEDFARKASRAALDQLRTAYELENSGTLPGDGPAEEADIRVAELIDPDVLDPVTGMPTINMEVFNRNYGDDTRDLYRDTQLKLQRSAQVAINSMRKEGADLSMLAATYELAAETDLDTMKANWRGGSMGDAHLIGDLMYEDFMKRLDMEMEAQDMAR